MKYKKGNGLNQYQLMKLEQWIREGKAYKDIGDEFNLAKSTIHYYVKKYKFDEKQVTPVEMTTPDPTASTPANNNGKALPPEELKRQLAEIKADTELNYCDSVRSETKLLNKIAESAIAYLDKFCDKLQPFQLMQLSTVLKNLNTVRMNQGYQQESGSIYETETTIMEMTMESINKV